MRLVSGNVTVIGEELTRPVSALTDKLPFTRTSQDDPPDASVAQAPPVYLHGYVSIISIHKYTLSLH